MFFEFARAIKKIKPKIFVGENVRGLMSHEKGRTIEIMINVLMELGYNIQGKVLKAINYDVPQKRERTFIVGTLPGYRFKFPRQRNYMLTLKDALENVPESMGAKYNDQKAEILKHVPPGGYWRDLPIDLQKIYMKKSFYLGGGKTGMARRMSWDEPCLTLTTSPQQKQTERCHPDETRPFTVREYARIQTFPDEWQFAGAMTSQYKQIGNAVPVNLAEHVGREIVRTLNQETKFHDGTTCVADICSICKLPEKFFNN